jgi:hypothetical protein
MVIMNTKLVSDRQECFPRAELGLWFLGATASFGFAGAALANETLHVLEHEDTDKTIHLGKGATDSVGDFIVFANPIFDSANAHQVGIVQGDCVRVIVGKSWECSFSLVMGKDILTLEGPYADVGESVFAITGGAGKYASAKGQMSLRVGESKPNGAPAPVDMVYDIR